MVFETFSEQGFGRTRFKGTQADPDTATLTDVLPLLVRMPDKDSLTVDQISGKELQRIVDTAAGENVELSWEERGAVLATTSLAKRSLSLSVKRPCGLRDLIFFACLLRVHALLPNPREVPMPQLFELTWALITEQLPQAIDYSSQVTNAEASYGYAPPQSIVRETRRSNR